MARTAPAVDGTPDFQKVSFAWIDASGDLRSDSLQVPAAATSAQIEAFAEALADISNAVLYKIEVSAVYNSVPDKSSAVEAPKDSVYDNLGDPDYLQEVCTDLNFLGNVRAAIRRGAEHRHHLGRPAVVAGVVGEVLRGFGGGVHGNLLGSERL